MKSRTDWFIDIVFWISVIVVLVMFFVAILTLATEVSRKAPPCPAQEETVILPLDAPQNGP